MRTVFIALISILLSTTSSRGILESYQDLGHGFSLETHYEHTNNAFESFGHFEYLYYEDTRLGQCSAFEVEFSPTERYAFFPHSSSYRVYDSWTGRLFRLATSEGVLKRVKWDENANMVTVIYKSNPSQSFKLK